MEQQSIIFDKVSDISKLIIFERNNLTQDHIKKLLEQPWWNQYHEFVNKILTNICHGTHLVSVPWDNEEMKKLVDNPENIKLIISDEENTIFKLMRVSSCHDNAMKLLKTNNAKEMHTGLALSKDRLWRHHSWAISLDGKIIETTISRLVYLPITIITKKKYNKLSLSNALGRRQYVQNT